MTNISTCLGGSGFDDLMSCQKSPIGWIRGPLTCRYLKNGDVEQFVCLPAIFVNCNQLYLSQFNLLYVTVDLSGNLFLHNVFRTNCKSHMLHLDVPGCSPPTCLSYRLQHGSRSNKKYFLCAFFPAGKRVISCGPVLQLYRRIFIFINQVVFQTVCRLKFPIRK